MLKYNPEESPAKEWAQLDEQQQISLVEDYHKNEALPNLTLHAAMHVIVENQIMMGDKLPAKSTLLRLISEGLDRHSAIHLIGSILSEDIFDMMKNNTAFSKEKYEKKLKNITAKIN